MTRQETNNVKQFLSKTDDIYRAAYGKTTSRYPRRCVFFGTSNEISFLKDRTGNRRFWPINVGVLPPSRNIWEELPQEVDQIWAEAVMYYRLGEPLYIDKRLEQLARDAQEEHREESPREGMIREFLDRPVPENWNGVPLRSRKAFWANPVPPEGVRMEQRRYVCAAEIWCECFNGEMKYMKNTDAREINQILGQMEDWEKCPPRKCGDYGSQRGFRRLI